MLLIPVQRHKLEVGKQLGHGNLADGDEHATGHM
jgi:hypothetical protein